MLNFEQITIIDTDIVVYTSSTTAKLNESVTLKIRMGVPRNGTVTLDWAIGSSGFIFHRNETMVNGLSTLNFGFSQTGIWQFKARWHGDAASNPAESEVTVTP